MIRLHQQIAVDLRHDGSRCNRYASAVASDERDLRHLDALQRHRVEEEHVRTESEVFDGLGHRQLAGAEDVDAVDDLRLDHADGDGAGARQDVSADGQPVLGVEELGVVDSEEGRIGVEDHAGRDDGPGQTAAADLVRAGDAPKTKIAEPALDG